ncbi:hypothetical protein [Candidatus Pantoea soli]|uniref:Uncharacterized protein n=1 Tax=Candidatus Pantoea soli TaxID=3098669 RepID=A0A518XJX1_9GAMM|nr:hypothetical protein [Pantoea soli]QDY44489.1 hypothetical protein D8B20_21420 [Pantoea soli]
MATEDEVLKKLRERDAFAENDKADGIAQRGIDKGYATLSPAQQHVLEPYMSLPCDGVEDPGGHPNDCSKQLQGAELLQALDDEGYYDALLCEDCRSDYYDWYE